MHIIEPECECFKIRLVNYPPREKKLLKYTRKSLKEEFK